MQQTHDKRSLRSATAILGGWAGVLLTCGFVYNGSAIGISLLVAGVLTLGSAGVAFIGRWLLGSFAALLRSLRP